MISLYEVKESHMIKQFKDLYETMEENYYENGKRVTLKEKIFWFPAIFVCAFVNYIFFDGE